MEKMTKAEIKKQEERLRKKLVAQMNNMQYMWIPMHRMTAEEIEGLDQLELESQHRKHSTLWTEFKSKPIAPVLCMSCGVQTGKYENHLLNDKDVMEWYNDECRDCMSETY
tara:strand:- start:119 stop:451 length:333 start_codon:yes stop_codon:yes gene_type:complete